MSTKLFNESLKGLTFITIGAVMNGSLDPFTFEDKLNHASAVRRIVGHVQILSFEGSLEQGCILQLGFSPFYLESAYYAFVGLDGDFKWQLTLPIYKTSDPGDDDYDGVDEIGLVEWLTFAEIKTDEPRIESIAWTLPLFLKSL
jgi:hypothetical protein